ncbi:MAG: TrkA family potassium uptake protein [Lachnospiraceae bacterium]|nr:TrkA family potassium uptake protein [Lachnospiraceae bacterium]MBR0152496.1 TrkA family potassium uptake protein [Lachnospiraceae bacterium]
MKSILLIGLGRFGREIAIQLNELGHSVMAVDRDEERVNAVLPVVTGAQIGDSTNPAFLEDLGVNNFDVCIVAIGDDFKSSLETASLLKEFGGKLVVARAECDMQVKFLKNNGADEVIYPEKEMARWAAVRYSADHILDYIALDDSHAILEVPVPAMWTGKSIGQIDIRRRYNVTIMAVKRNGRLHMSITPETVLTEDMSILVTGEYRALAKCFRI